MTSATWPLQFQSWKLRYAVVMGLPWPSSISQFTVTPGVWANDRDTVRSTKPGSMRNTILIGLISKEADKFLSTQPRFALDLFYREPEAVHAFRYRLGLRVLWVPRHEPDSMFDVCTWRSARAGLR